jgi:hypothetical protein
MSGVEIFISSDVLGAEESGQQNTTFTLDSVAAGLTIKGVAENISVQICPGCPFIEGYKGISCTGFEAGEAILTDNSTRNISERHRIIYKTARCLR